MASITGDGGSLVPPLGVDVAPDLVDHTTAAAVEEKKKLKKHFGRFDMLFFLICTLVGVDTIGAVAALGPQSFTWMIFLAITFFLPYALLTAELGTAFTEEGGPYVWTRLAFGRFVASINALLYWVSNPIWLGGSLTIIAVTAFNTFFIKMSLPWQYVFSLIFIWFSVWAAILSFSIGKWIPTIGAWGRMAVLGFFTLSVVIYAIQHGVHGFGGSGFSPTYVAFIGLVPLLIFNYVGFELPNAAGDEMKNPQRDVPFTVARSAVGTVILYGVPILSILLVLPQNQVTSLSGFTDAIKAVFTVYGGHVAADGTATLTGAGQVLGGIAAILFIWALVSSGTTWIMGADRAMAVASYDGAGPRILGTFSSRFGTPIAVNLLSGIMSTIVMVLAIQITQGNAHKYFAVVLSLAISTTTISYLAIFPALIKLRYSHPHVRRPYRVPWGNTGAWICAVVTTFWSALATVGLLWPGIGVGWFGTSGSPDASLPSSFANQRWSFEVTQLIPIVVLLAVGVVFYIAGSATRRQEVTVPLQADALPAR